MELNKDYVKIVNGQPGMIELLGDSTSVVAVIHLDKGQRVREIKYRVVSLAFRRGGGLLQAHLERVAFLMQGLSVFISLAGFEQHWLVAQRAPWKLSCVRHKLGATLLEAFGFNL